MALEGSLREFGLADILQLIGMQRKTGILNLEHEDERVELRFLDGAIVGAETEANSVESRLGQVLVRTGKITESQLAEALQLQKRSLQRLGHILVKHKFISEAELVDALRVQSLQIVLGLFRWRDGSYSVRLLDDIDYDEAHFTPISSDTVLMEGARMVDEWPIIERRIPSGKIVFERTEAARSLDADGASLVGAECQIPVLFDDAAVGQTSDKRSLSLTAEERQILNLIDGKKNVQEICDHASLGEFDTYRTLHELCTRDLIRQVKQRAAAESSQGARLLGRVARGALGLALAGACAAGVATLSGNPFTPWKVGNRAEVMDQLRGYASRARLEQIERAVRVFYLDSGAVPTDLEQLATLGYVKQNDLLDPWGRPYGYQVSAGGYHLSGLDAAGEPAEGLSFAHRFSAVQLMLLQSRSDDSR